MKQEKQPLYLQQIVELFLIRTNPSSDDIDSFLIFTDLSLTIFDQYA